MNPWVWSAIVTAGMVALAWWLSDKLPPWGDDDDDDDDTAFWIIFLSTIQ